MGAALIAAYVDCTKNQTVTFGGTTAELAQMPVYAMLFTFSGLATICHIVILIEAYVFIATRVPRSSVANHRLNTAILMSMYPAFVLFSFPALLIPTASEFCLAILDLFFAFLMFKFIVLVVDYYGGHRKMMARLAAEKVVFKVNVGILSCFFCFRPARLTRQSFTFMKLAVLQTAILKPIMTFATAIANLAGAPFVGTAKVVLSVLTITSSVTAMTALNMLAKSSGGKALEKYSVKYKAAAMTGGIILLNLQSAILDMVTIVRPLGCTIPFPPNVYGAQWQAVLLTIEATLIMIPMLRLYRTADGNVVGVPPPINWDEEEEPTSGLGKMRQWVRRHTLI